MLGSEMQRFIGSEVLDIFRVFDGRSGCRSPKKRPESYRWAASDGFASCEPEARQREQAKARSQGT
jgi:hypothetical protein